MQGSLKDGALALNLQLTGSPLSRLGSSVIKGSVSGTGAISGTMSQPVVDIALALKDGRVGNDNLSFSGLATLSHGAVQARALRVDYLSHHLSDGAGSVELKTGSYTFSAHYKGEYLADPIRLNADLSGQVLPGRAGSVPAGVMDQGLQGRLSLSSIVVGEAAIPSWSIAFRMDQGKVTLDGGPGNSIHGWIDAQRSFYLSLANPLPVIAALRGRVVEDHITSSRGRGEPRHDDAQPGPEKPAHRYPRGSTADPPRDLGGCHGATDRRRSPGRPRLYRAA